MSLLIKVTKLAFLQDKGKYILVDSNVFYPKYYIYYYNNLNNIHKTI